LPEIQIHGVGRDGRWPRILRRPESQASPSR
jgi:hypothetical protein